MKITLEIPGKDFQKLAKNINNVAFKSQIAFGNRVKEYETKKNGYYIYVTKHENLKNYMCRPEKVKIEIRTLKNGN